MCSVTPKKKEALPKWVMEMEVFQFNNINKLSQNLEYTHLAPINHLQQKREKKIEKVLVDAIVITKVLQNRS